MRRSRRSLPPESGADSDVASPHAIPHINPCPVLAAGFVAASRLSGVFGNCYARALVRWRRKNCPWPPVWPPVPRSPHAPTVPAPFGLWVPPLPPVRAVFGPLPAVPWHVGRAPRLAGGDPTLHSALRPIRGRALERIDQHGSGQG